MTPQATTSQHFDVSAAYEAPAKKGATANIVVEFKRKDPDVNINEEPAARMMATFSSSDRQAASPLLPRTRMPEKSHAA